MKKSVLVIVLLLVFGFEVLTQNNRMKSGLKSLKAPSKEMIGIEPINSSAVGNTHYQTPLVKSGSEINDLNIISIGSSANAYSAGYAGGQRTLVWADQNLNTIVNIHRNGGVLDPGGYSGDLSYDISTDGGLTWTNQIEYYMAQMNSGGTYYLDAARFPQGAIYNPPGNTNPDNAFVTYFAPALFQTNDIWGAIVHGRGNIGNIEDTTKNFIYSDTTVPAMCYLPQGYTITQTGEIWTTDINSIWTTGAFAYAGNIVVYHGTWNNALQDFEFERSLLDLPTTQEGAPIDTKVAFAPDGMHGWIGVLADNGSVPISAGRSYYPILWKTNDGGETWEGPIPVALAGEDGNSGVQNLFSDDQLEQLYGVPVPPLDEIEFTTAYDFDLHVDYLGNPHIAVVVGITGEDPYSIITERLGLPGWDDNKLYMAAMDIFISIYSDDWWAFDLGRLTTFRGTFGDLTEDNRIQIASSWDGKFMFVTWNDTNLPSIEENIQPDIFCRGISSGYNLTQLEGWVEEPYNMTENSAGMWQSFFQSLSHYVFYNDTSTNYQQYFIPVTYLDMNQYDPIAPVRYKYITNYNVSEFTTLYLGIDEKNQHENQIQISQCYPNPCKGFTQITVIAPKPTNLLMNLTNQFGQIVSKLPEISCTTVSMKVNIDVSGLQPGVYLLVAETESEKVVRKIVVR
jgi:hypothetical protein